MNGGNYSALVKNAVLRFADNYHIHCLVHNTIISFCSLCSVAFEGEGKYYEEDCYDCSLVLPQGAILR